MPRPLRKGLAGHVVVTVTDRGWAGKSNGELLRLMLQDGIQVLLTADQNLRHQQNLSQAGVSIVVMVAPSNRLERLEPLVPDVLAALRAIRPGDVVEISG